MNCFGQELSQLSFTNEELEKCRDWLKQLQSVDNLIVGLEVVGTFYQNYISDVLTSPARL